MILKDTSPKRHESLWARVLKDTSPKHTSPNTQVLKDTNPNRHES